MHPLQSFFKKGAESLKDTGIEATGLSLNLGSIAPTLANALLKSECKKDRIIIFDDFERCVVPIQERLGAINIYVEHEECQVIVISNDEKINTQEFSDAKEKLFGSTYKIEAETSSIFDIFISEYNESKNHNHLKNSKEDILIALKAGNINSLRILKHVISDIDNFYSCLEEKHFQKKQALSYITKLFTALSAEIRSGNLDLKVLSGRSSHGVNYMMSGISKKEPTPETIHFTEINKKYESIGINLDSPIISDKAIELSLIRGLFEKESFLENLNKSTFFAEPDEIPAWRKMLELDRLDDKSTEETKNELLSQFDKRLLSHPGEMLHLFSFRILMSEIGVIDSDLETVKKQCIDYINDVFENRSLKSIKDKDYMRRRLITSHDSQGYWLAEENKELFHEIYDHLCSKMDELDEIQNELNSREILEMISNDTEKFIRSISHSNLGDSTIADIPILKYIPADDFVDAFLSAPRRLWHDIQYSLERRYGNHSFYNSLGTEANWTIELIDSFERKLNTLEGFSKYRLQRAIPFKIKEIAQAFLIKEK